MRLQGWESRQEDPVRGSVAPARSDDLGSWGSHWELGNTSFHIPPVVLAPVSSGKRQRPSSDAGPLWALRGQKLSKQHNQCGGNGAQICVLNHLNLGLAGAEDAASSLCSWFESQCKPTDALLHLCRGTQ